MESNTPVETARVTALPNSPKELLKYKNAEEVFREHSLKNTRYIIYRNEVFSAGEYLDKQGHPGGEAVLREYFGRDVTDKMHELKHSKSAYKTLNKYKVGEVLNKVEYSIDRNAEGNNRLLKGHSLISEEMADKLSRRFDLTKPILAQIMDETLTREEYLGFIKEPKIMEDPTKQVRIFESNFLEFFSSTPWYAIPLFYIPILITMLTLNIRCMTDFCPYKAIGLGLLGLLEWTLFEYCMHRFIFHYEDNLPVHPYVFGFHFLIHGIHHAFPQDPGRLVFPIIEGVIVGLIKIFMVCCVIPYDQAVFYIVGFAIGYMMYDMIHYYVHHASSFKLLDYQKIYHQKHHHKDPNRGFGVSSPFWDLIFGTFLN